MALVPIYVERMLAGSVSPETEPTVMHDAGSTIVLDACHILGPLSSDWTLPMVSERAREHGPRLRHGAQRIALRQRRVLGAPDRRGRPGRHRHVQQPSVQGAAGGVERLTGANSLAIALPSTDSHPFVVELDSGGAPADAAAAIAAMLVPGASAKGFGLAAAIDLLCGGLSEGALGPEVGAFDGDPAQPYGCAHLFMAIDPARFGIAGLGERVARYAARIRGSRRAHGVARIYAPGDRERARRAESGDECLLTPSCSRGSRNAARRSASRRSCDGKREIRSAKLRAPSGHFSQAIEVEAKGRIVFLSGMTARRADGTIAGVGDIEAQTRQVCENLKGAVEAAGGSLDDVCRVDVYVRNMEHFEADPQSA